MGRPGILNLPDLVKDGVLFRPHDDRHRVEAYLSPMGCENHAPNLLALPNGDLLCVWFAGSQEGISDVSIAMSRLPNGAARWTAPVRLSHDPDRSEQNPVLFFTPDGKLWLLYTAQETRGCTRAEWERRVAAGEARGSFTMQWTAIIRRRISEDYGHTWGPVETFMGQPTSFCRQPIVIMSNGEWLFPMYYSILDDTIHGGDYSVMQISSDEGRTWTPYPVPQSRGRVHASVVEIGGGHLVAFFRSRAADRIYISRSSDYGRTWSPPQRTSLPNNNSSIQATRLSSGHIALAFNHISVNDDPTQTIWPQERYPVTVAISEDNGESWPYMRHVETGDNFCGAGNVHLNRQFAYPCILQTRDGMIHIAFSYRWRHCIKYMCISEDWIRQQCDVIYDTK